MNPFYYTWWRVCWLYEFMVSLTDVGVNVGCCEKRKACKWGRDPAACCHRSPERCPATSCACEACSPCTIATSALSVTGVGGHITTVTCRARCHHTQQRGGAIVFCCSIHSEQPPISSGANRWGSCWRFTIRWSVSLELHIRPFFSLLRIGMETTAIGIIELHSKSSLSVLEYLLRLMLLIKTSQIKLTREQWQVDVFNLPIDEKKPRLHQNLLLYFYYLCIM